MKCKEQRDEYEEGMKREDTEKDEYREHGEELKYSPASSDIAKALS